MNKQEKLFKLVELSQEAGSQIDKYIRSEDLLRLVKGDLSHIGEALIKGDEILLNSDETYKLSFRAVAECYTNIPKTVMIGDMEVPAPLQSFDGFEEGDTYYSLYIHNDVRCVTHYYKKTSLDNSNIITNTCYKNEEDLHLFIEAIRKLGK